MQYLFHSSNLTDPTVETFEDYARHRFSGLERLLDAEHAKVNTSITKLGTKQSQFEIRVEVRNRGHQYIAKSVENTVTEAVDRANKLLKRQIRRYH